MVICPRGCTTGSAPFCLTSNQEKAVSVGCRRLDPLHIMSTNPAPSASPRFALTRDRVHDVLAALCEEAGIDSRAADDAELIKFTNNAVYRLPRAGLVVRIAGSATVAERVPVAIEAARWLARHDVKVAYLGKDVCKVRCGYSPDNLAALRAVALVFLGRLGQDTMPDVVPWESYEAFTRPLDVIGLR